MEYDVRWRPDERAITRARERIFLLIKCEFSPATYCNRRPGDGKKTVWKRFALYYPNFRCNKLFRTEQFVIFHLSRRYLFIFSIFLEHHYCALNSSTLRLGLLPPPVHVIRFSRLRHVVDNTRFIYKQTIMVKVKKYYSRNFCCAKNIRRFSSYTLNIHHPVSVTRFDCKFIRNVKSYNACIYVLYVETLKLHELCVAKKQREYFLYSVYDIYFWNQKI